MTELPFLLDLELPFLIVRFDSALRTLGWSITKPRFASAREVAWLEVRDGDLALHIDPVDFLEAKLSSRGLADAAGFMTSREISRYQIAQARIGPATVTCLTTVGLSNGERIGRRSRQEICDSGGR